MKFLNKSTFRIHLALWLITLVTISTTFFFSIYYNLSKDSLNNVIKDNLGNISKNKVDYINTWISDNQNFIKLLSQSSVITNSSPKSIDESLGKYTTLSSNFYEIIFADAKGNINFSSINSEHINIYTRDYFTAAKQNKDYISDRLISRTTGDSVIVISSPIFIDNQFKGLVAGIIKVSEISKLISPHTFENINETFIANKRNEIISISNTTNNQAETINDIPKSPIYKKFITDAIIGNFFIEEYTNHKGKQVFGSFTTLKNKNWVLVSEIEISKQMKLIKKSSVVAGIITLILTTVLMVPFVLYLTKKLTIPIKKISDMATELSSGNFSNRIYLDSNTEIGLLANSFNTMADKLQTTYLELRKKIFDLNTQKEEVNFKNLKLQQVIEVNKTILNQLESKNNELEEANKIKAEFLSTMTHELRTPMNSIIGYTEMILDGNDGEINDEQAKDLSIILKSSEKLLGMINDVLGLSKIEAGKMNYKFKRFNLINEISNLIEDIRVMAEFKNLDLLFDYDPDLPEIYSDADKINHILTNILSNAVKFTDEGTIKLSIGFEKEKYVKIMVADTGIGIPESELENIFDEFKQLDGSSTRRFGGTGLGLTIAKAFAEGLGGNISVQSELNNGSVFTLTVPVSKSSKAVKESPIHTNIDKEVEYDFENLKNLEQKLIVVITKNLSNYHAIKNILSEYNFSVFVSDYPNAIETVKKLNPGCIFIDIDVPCSNCFDGWTILLDLQQDKYASLIPKVVITTQLDNNLGFSLGAMDYLIKPIKDQELLHCINRCFSQQNRGYALLIDDNRDNINLFSKAIRVNSPYSTLIVTSLNDVTNVLESSNTPKLIILNAGISKVTSFEIIRKINKLNIKKKIPIIIISDKELSRLEFEFLRQSTGKILVKSDIRYSNVVCEIKKVMIDSKKYDIMS